MTRSYLDNCGNSRANTCFASSDPRGKSAFISSKPIVVSPFRRRAASQLVTLDNFVLIAWPFVPATHLSNVCPIKCRWYVICLPCL